MRTWPGVPGSWKSNERPELGLPCATADSLNGVLSSSVGSVLEWMEVVSI